MQYVKVNGVHCRDGENEKIVYHLLVDTGDPALSWIYSNEQPIRRINEQEWLDPRHGWSEAQIGKEWATKCKIPVPVPRGSEVQHRFGLLGTEFAYLVAGIPTVVDLELHGLSTVPAADRDGIRDVAPVSNFVVDAAVGINKAAFFYTEGADGMLAFGRGGAGVQPRTVNGFLPDSVQGVLVRNHKMSSHDFWMRIAHLAFDFRLQDFMCLGRYHDPFGMFPIVTGVNLTVQPSSNHWKLYLQDIAYMVPHPNGAEALVVEEFRVGVDVIIDSGASGSWLPEPCVKKIQEFLKNRFGSSRLGKAPTQMDRSHLVRFQFAETRETARHQPVYGFARRFLVSQLHNQDGSPEPDCDVHAVQHGDVYLLGLNFFRTFMIGFHDGSLPSVTLVGQRDLNYP